MNKLVIKIFTFLVIVLISIKPQAQEIRFPESFKLDTTLLKGMRLAEIPQEAQIKYGVTKNPGLITDPSKTKGFLMSGNLKNVQAVYFEIYKNEEETLSYGFEVAKFNSVAEMDEILPKTNSRSESVILLTLKNYLIMVYGPPSNGVGERLDNLAKFFQQKLGARLIQDRKKDLETSVVDDYVSNLPPPLPPEPVGNYTSIAIEDLDKGIANADGLAYMRTKNRKKLVPGKYRASSTYPAFESLAFTIDKDSLLNGDYQYHYAEDYSKSPSKESKLTYDHGVLVSEIVYEKGKLIGSTNHTVTVIKEGKDYIITRNTITKSPKYGTQEVKTVFRNRKPVSKITASLGVSVARRDFEKNTFENYNNKGQLTKLQKPGLTEEYTNGIVTYKEVWVGDNQFIYRDGKLRYQEIRVKGKDQFLVTEFDADGKVSNKRYKGIENNVGVANPDEYESNLTQALFEYYKKKVIK